MKDLFEQSEPSDLSRTIMDKTDVSQDMSFVKAILGTLAFLGVISLILFL